MRHKISLIVAILAVVGTVAAGVTGEYSFETKAPQIADKSGKHSTPLVLAREDMWSPKGGIVFPKEKDGLRLPEKAFNMPRGSFTVTVKCDNFSKDAAILRLWSRKDGFQLKPGGGGVVLAYYNRAKGKWFSLSSGTIKDGGKPVVIHVTYDLPGKMTVWVNGEKRGERSVEDVVPEVAPGAKLVIGNNQAGTETFTQGRILRVVFSDAPEPPADRKVAPTAKTASHPEIGKGIPVSGSVFLDANANGRRDPGEPGLPKIPVSDGRTIAETDAKGNFAFPAVPEKGFVRVVLPTGYLNTKNTPWYVPAAAGRAEFALVRDPEPSGRIVFIAGADIQYDIAKNLEKWQNQCDRLKKIADDADAAFLIIAGDLTPFGNREDLRPIRDGLTAKGLRYFPVFGGHDAIVTKRDTCNYREFFGPEYYSFNYRGTHFIVLLSETSFLPKTELARQWEYLKNDLARLSPETPTVVVCHTPDLICRELKEIQDKCAFTTLLMGHYHQNHRYQVRKTSVWDNSPWRELDWGLHTLRVRIFSGRDGNWQLDEVKFHPSPIPLPPLAGKMRNAPKRDWTDFWGGNGARRTDAELRLPLRRVWSKKIDDLHPFYSSPVIAGGRICCALAGKRSGVIALDAETGKEAWFTPLPGPFHSTALFADNKIFAANDGGDLWALDANTGKVLWSSPAPECRDLFRFRCNINPLAKFGNMVVATGAFQFRAVDMADGRTAFLRESPYPDNIAAGGATLNDLILMEDQEKISAVDPTGKIRWEVRRAALKLRPIKRERGLAPGGSDGKHLYAVGRSALRKMGTDGSEVWAAPLPSPLNRLGTPAIGGGRVFISAREMFYAFSDADGKPLWSFRTDRDPAYGSYQQYRNDSSPALAKDKVVFGSDAGKLYVLDAESGKMLQQISVNSPIKASPAISDNMVCIIDFDGQIHVFEGAEK